MELTDKQIKRKKYYENNKQTSKDYYEKNKEKIKAKRIEESEIGKIYKITSRETPRCYIGSTIQKIETRFSEHKSTYKKWIKGTYGYCTSFEIIKFFDCSIELLEEIKQPTDDELLTKEKEYINKTDMCTNTSGKDLRLKTGKHGKKYKGLTFDVQRNTWRISLTRNGKRLNNCRFNTQDEAYTVLKKILKEDVQEVKP